MSHQYHPLLDLYCHLPNEFVIAYPQPSYNYHREQHHQQKRSEIHRNTNALERSSLSRCKPKNLLHPYRHHGDNIAREMTKKIMSIDSPDHEVDFYMVNESAIPVKHHRSSQMADGDRNKDNSLNNFHDDEEQIMKMMQKDSIRPLTCKQTFKQAPDAKSFLNPISHLPSSRIYESTLPLNRTSTWRKLQANITPSHYNHIQQFQRKHLQQLPSLSIPHPIMLSPLTRETDTVSSQIPEVSINSCVSPTSLSIGSSTNLSDCGSDTRIINVNQQLFDDNFNEDTPIISSLKNNGNTIYDFCIDHKEKSLVHTAPPSPINHTPLDDPYANISLHEIEEFQPTNEILSPSIFLNDILSSLFPSKANHLVFHTNDNICETQYMLLDNNSDMTEFLIIAPSQPSDFSRPCIIEEIFETSQPKKVQSLYHSIEELCHLIRKLLQYELTEQKTTPLQATIASQLAILLTYLAIPNNEKIVSKPMAKETIEKMTLTDENTQKSLLSTIETQTDIEWISPSKTLLESANDIDYPIQDLSHTELLSTSVTLHLPGRRLLHALSDTFIYHCRHHEQHSSSYYRLTSLSETILNSSWSVKQKTENLRRKIHHCIELESSNTCLEASTEFTPDFLLTTINKSKYDDDDDDDQTEQFGIDTEKQDYHSDTMSLIINEKQDKIDTLTLDSIDKENYDSLELEKEYPIFNSISIHHSIDEEDGIPKNSIVLPIDNNLIPSGFNQLNNKSHVGQLLEPLGNTYQWKVPVLPRKSSSADLLYEKQTGKIVFKYAKIRSNSNNGMNIIGKRVRIKSDSLSQSSATIKPQSKPSTLNYNNNYNDHTYSWQSRELSLTSIDSLNSDTLENCRTDQCEILPKKLCLLMNYSKSNELIAHCSLPNIPHNHDNLVKTSSFPITTSSHLTEVTDKLDSNIALAENLLDMLDSLNNNNNNNNHSSTIKIDLLHTYIRQFLIEFDARIRLDRKRRRSKPKHEKVVH